jgi:NhaP-type Na+/H+ or K+/H+ antiporter
MLELFPAAAELAWPIVVALAWLAGELGHRISIPRISTYGLVGFAFGPAQLGWLRTEPGGSGILLASIAFGLILFEFGYRINVRWVRTNPWLGLTGLLESTATFVAVYVVVRLMGVSQLTGLLLASLSMATSPASLMRVVNEQRGSGQVTERILHLAAINCVLAVFTFNVIVGFWTFDSSGNLWQAVSKSVLVLLVSAGLGAGFGTGVPGLLRRTGRVSQDATVAFALAVIVLVGITHALKFSPLVATLTFGLVARHRRMTLDQTQRNFGALGDLLSVVLFVYVANTIDGSRVLAGAAIGAALLVVRMAVKVFCVAALAHNSGTSVRKGVLTGLGQMPLSVFVILLLEHTRYIGIDLVDHLAPLAAATLVLELLGPLATQQALRLAGETNEPDEA